MNFRVTRPFGPAVLLSWLMLPAGPSPASATPVAIQNASFEEPAFAPGAHGVGAPGWISSGTGGGVWNISDANNPFMNTPAPAGSQVGFVAQDADPDGPGSLMQTLAANLLPDAVYTFTGYVGHPLGFGGTVGTSYTIELLAGGSVLASLTGTGPEGSLQGFQLVYDSAGSGLVGQPLAIRLGGSQAQTLYDGLALQVSAVPEPSAALLLGVAAVAARLTLARRRRRPASPAAFFS